MKTLLINICLFVLSYSAFACDCSVDDYINFKKADLVFVGKVIKIENVNEYEINRITLQICEMQKGKIRKKKITIVIPCMNEVCCGVEFILNEKYKVFSVKRGKDYFTNLCSETVKLD
ncbi:MAG: hypothetical protein BGO31_00830 [Bacteroidetes bacterium 43-16]|uniref:hypothetical protein n=1 Tax=uncultured Dysgonomonas sp. TaxID=206096 RepID=UPI00092B3C56|nr:hypothetical protein [uncultured Dysgonomonas sp.]OJV51600.1 MAG: hypothetical protein BGO31_00830 [Bacteroidetes bacterium 43-16]